VGPVNPTLPLASVRTLDEIQADSIAQTSFALVMLAIAATVALLLGSVGIYGVIAYVVTQRTREIGIRMALGATRAEVLRLIVGQGMALTLVGVAIGVAVSLGITRFLRTLLFGVSPYDPSTFVAITALLSGVALVAAFVPGRRASNVSPTEALRYE